MKHIALSVMATSPLAIRSDQSSTGVARARYIPGSTLMGGLTMFYRQLYEGNSEKIAQFAPLFLNEQVFYPNLYPAIFVDSRGAQHDKGIEGAGALQDRNQLPVYPVPQTAQSCKRHPGFRF